MSWSFFRNNPTTGPACGGCPQISLAMCTEGLLNGDGIQPSWATSFVWSLTLLVATAKKIRAQSATDATISLRRGGVPTVFDKAMRQALLTYFILNPCKYEQDYNGDDKSIERDEGGYGAGGGENSGDVASKRDITLFSPTPPPSLGARPVARGHTSIVTRESLLEGEDDRERDLALGAETFTVTVDINAREMPLSGVLQTTRALAQHAGEDTTFFRKSTCGSSCHGIEKCSARLDSREWYTTGACIVCLGEYSRGDHLCRMPCGHTYHAACIDEWLDIAEQPCCPLCKKDLREEFSAVGATTTGSTEGPTMGNAGIESV